VIECLVIGDSIAVGVASARPECATVSRVGVTSHQWVRDYLSKVVDKPAEVVVISLGANDHPGIRTEEHLRKIRSSIQALHVFWISPGSERKPGPQSAIERIAEEYGDTVLPRPSSMSPDGVHPTGRGYKQLADQTKVTNGQR
jgi:lysophospholipase L1-like esterase